MNRRDEHRHDPSGRRLAFAAGLLPCLLIAALLPAPPAAAEEDAFVEQGPAVMSEEEKAIEADAALQQEHGVILMVQVRRKEDDPRELKYGLHLRAKILSDEARSLGDIEIPYDAGTWDLKEWWGRVIQPDGTVLELDRGELEEQEIRRSRGRSITVRKGALPGVVPGSVIDYGYVLQQDNARYVDSTWRMRLQWDWPVRELHYTWTPYEYLPSGFVATRARNLDVETRRDFKHVRVTGHNLTPVKEEPWMPPEDSVRASVWFFYFNKDEKYKDFWNDKAKLVERRAAEFMDNRKAVDALLEDAGLNGDEPLDAKLRKAYDWIVANIAIDNRAFDEGLDTLRGDRTVKSPLGVKEVVQGGRGADVHRLLLMMGLARALGAEANIVLATDRTDHYWNSAVWSLSQFDEALVAVRAPGEPESEATLLAPHLGLAYGEIPYWVTASKALMATAEGAREITPPASPAEANTSLSEVKMSFETDGEPAHVVWTRTGTGQHAIEQKFLIRGNSESERARRLDRICGKGSAFEVESSKSLASEGDDPAPGVECEGALPEIVAEEGLDAIAVPIDGPWIEAYPDFTAKKRVQPMVFDYPCVDTTVMEVASPPGYEPAGAPEPETIDNPFGKYSLSIETTPEGYRVERTLRLPHLSLPPDRLPGLRYFLTKVKKADRAALTFRPAGGGA